MTTTLNLTRTRGDTYPIKMTMTNPDGTPMDLTNKQVILTANTEEDPIDTTNQVFQIVGTITDAEAGTVEFAPTLEQADNVGLFYFDVEVSDVSSPTYLWTAEAGVADDPYPVDGSKSVFFLLRHANDSIVYQQRDGIDVVRIEWDSADSSFPREFISDVFPRVDLSKNWRLSGKQYMNESWWLILMMTSYFSATNGVELSFMIENEPGYRGVELFSGLINPATQVRYYNNNNDGGSESHVAGWIEWKVEWEASTGVVRGRTWQPPTAEHGTWDFTEAGLVYQDELDLTNLTMRCLSSGSPTNIDIAWLKLEILP